MALIKQKHGGSINRFEKGKSGNPIGRERKFISTLKAQGYSASEVMNSISVMLAMTSIELKAVFENPDTTMLERTIAGAIKKDIQKGSLHSIEILLNRAYGRPREMEKIPEIQKITGITVNYVYSTKEEMEAAKNENDALLAAGEPGKDNN